MSDAVMVVDELPMYLRCPDKWPEIAEAVELLKELPAGKWIRVEVAQDRTMSGTQNTLRARALAVCGIKLTIKKDTHNKVLYAKKVEA